LRWKEIARSFGSSGAVEAARGSQVTFGLLSIRSPTFEEELEEWFEKFDEKGGAGVFFVARKDDGEGGKGWVMALHHLLVLEGSSVPDLVGIESLDASASFTGVNSVELFGQLSPPRGAKKAGAADFYVPSLEGLIDGSHPLTGKFVPGAKDDCLTIQTLENKINAVLVPVPLAQLLLGDEVQVEESDSEDDEAKTESFDQTDPLHLLRRLVKIMKYKKEKEPSWYKSWKPIAEEIIALLWAIANGFAVGVDTLPTPISRKFLTHQIKCTQELIASEGDPFDEDEDDRESKGSPERRSPRFLDKGSFGLEINPEGSPMGRQSPSPSARKEKVGFNIDSLPSPFSEEKEEAADPERSPPHRPGDHDLSPRVTVGASAQPGEGPPDWMGQMSGQFLAGFLATTKALTEAGISLKEFAKVNQKSIDDKEETKLATFKWIKSGEFLLKVLSSEDGWNTQGVPEFTELAQAIIKMKLFAATQHIRALAQEQEWPGCMLKSGVSEFLKRGLASENANVGPSGFSVLFFHPSSFTETDGDEFGLQQLRESFGDGKLPEDMMKSFNKLHIFVPKNTYEAQEQLETAILFLRSLCGSNTIATGGYSTGRAYLTRNRALFESKDRIFLVNFLYTLDRIFQHFCGEMKRYINEPDPIQVAKDAGAQRWMEKLVETPIQTWRATGAVPIYSPPSSWDDRKLSEGVVDLSSGKGRALSGGGGSAGSPSPKKKKVEKGSDDPKEEPWHRSLEPGEFIKEWNVPSSGKFFQFFNPDRPENFVGLPLVPHHRTGRKAYVCVRYIVENGPGCRLGLRCNRSHIRMSDLSQDEKDTITAHMKEVYAGKKKPS